LTWRQLAAGLAVIVLIVALLGVRASLSSTPEVGASPSANASPTVQASQTVPETLSSGPSPSASAETSPTPSPTPEPTPIPTPIPTPKPTAKPTAVPPTPQPTVTCIPEPTGWQATLPKTVVAGQSMQIMFAYMPAGQKMHLDVDYPDLSTVSIGDAYSVVVGDHTELTWTWTVPATMTPGTATARWSGGCGARSYDGSYTFSITAA